MGVGSPLQEVEAAGLKLQHSSLGEGRQRCLVIRMIALGKGKAPVGGASGAGADARAAGAGGGAREATSAAKRPRNPLRTPVRAQQPASS
eukprot:7802520-Pyramimonas_sp.AAC.1